MKASFDYRARIARFFLPIGCAMALVSVPIGGAFAQAKDPYATGTVRIVVTNAPGTAPDVIGRTLAQGLQDLRGHPTVVENKVGVSGVLGGDQVVRSAADGTSLLLVSDTVMTVLPHMPEKMPFNPLSDLKPIALVANAGYVLIAHPSLKVKTLAELVSLAKTKPGVIDYASTGVTSAHNRVMSQFMQASEIKLGHIPYGSTGPLTDVLAGTVPLMWSGLPGAIPHIQAGKLMALAVSSAQRHPSLPNVATVAELGYPGFSEGNWFGVVGPASMSPALVQRIQKDILSVVNSPTFRERMVAQGMEARAGGAEDFVKLIQVDHARMKSVLAKLPLAK